ncbi:TNF receptor-associated factor 3-like [Dermacentor albipictus]|uniref:TNF receptor-associated factor 3-like n=1 Tax=Dermacentor albipictus TaxID=60249 RepID=UPI0031FE1361
MAPSSWQHRLVGFSEEIDWKPLNFVRAIPANRICSACGLVHRNSALLDCGHVLCYNCYEHSAAEDGHVCPLDGGRYSEEDVEWRHFSAEKLLQREVKCWNEEAGCQAVISASNISKHYRDECQYHSISCPKCSATVLYHSAITHIMSGCRAVSCTPRKSENSKESDETVDIAQLRESLRAAVTEIKAGFQQIHGFNNAQKATLDHACQGINSLKEAMSVRGTKACGSRFAESAPGVRDIMEEVIETLASANIRLYGIFLNIKSVKEKVQQKATNEEVAKQAAEISTLKLEFKDRSQRVLARVEDVLLHLSLSTSRHEFILKKVTSLKEAALKNGSVLTEYRRLYSRAYCVVPGVYFKKNGDSVSLHISIHLEEGPFDDFLRWPFRHKIELSAVHPVSGKLWKLQFMNKNCHSPNLSKPGNGLGHVTYPSFSLNELERDGYLKEDELRFIWETLL